jgi:hypothetical protein
MSKISQHLSGIKALIKEDEEDGSDIGPLLIESKSENVDDVTKKKLLTAIKKGINAIIDYKGKKIGVHAKGGRRLMVVFFDSAFDELSVYVCEICDEFSYKFKTINIVSTNTIVFEIYK